MADKGWPVRTVTIGDGYNWTIEFYDPTVAEIDSLPTLDAQGQRAFLAGVIKSWDCVDRKGQPVPITAEGLASLPPKVMARLTAGLLGTDSPKAEGGAGSSQPTSPPASEGTA